MHQLLFFHHTSAYVSVYLNENLTRNLQRGQITWLYTYTCSWLFSKQNLRILPLVTIFLFKRVYLLCTFFLFQCYLWLRILLQPFCCQYDDTMSSGDVRLLFMYKWTSIFHLATKPQHFHAGRCLPQLGLIKRLILRECFETIYYVWWCQIRNMHLLVSLPPPSMFPFTGKTWPIRNINNSCPDHLTYKRFHVDQPNITNTGQTTPRKGK